MTHCPRPSPIAWLNTTTRHDEKLPLSLQTADGREILYQEAPWRERTLKTYLVHDEKFPSRHGDWGDPAQSYLFMPHDRNRVSSCINKILNKYENSLVVEIRRPKWWSIGEPENEEKCSSVAAVIL